MSEKKIMKSNGRISFKIFSSTISKKVYPKLKLIAQYLVLLFTISLLFINQTYLENRLFFDSNEIPKLKSHNRTKKFYDTTHETIFGMRLFSGFT